MSRCTEELSNTLWTWTSCFYFVLFVWITNHIITIPPKCFKRTPLPIFTADHIIGHQLFVSCQWQFVLAIISLPLDMNLLGLPFTKFTWSLSTWVTKKVVLWFVKYRVNQHTISSSSNTQVSPVQLVNCKPCLMSWCLIKQCLCPWTLHPVNGKRNNFTVLLSQLLDSLNVAKNHSNSIFVHSTTLFHVMRLCYNMPKNFY